MDCFMDKPKFYGPLILSIFFLTFIFILVWLGSAIVPLLTSFFMAYLASPLIFKLETKKIKRQYAVLAVFSIFTILIIAFLTLMIPKLISELNHFVEVIPQSVTNITNTLNLYATRFGFPIEINEVTFKELIYKNIKLIPGDLIQMISPVIQNVFSNFIKGFLYLMNLFLIPIFFFHLILKFESINMEFMSFIPNSLKSIFSHYLTLINKILSGYIRGQIIVVLILSMLYGIGLSIVGLKFGFLTGILTGLMSIIPFVGALSGLAASLFLAIATSADLGTYIGIAIVFLAVQALEGLFLTPKLVGNKVGLDALTTILAIIIGGNQLGIAGMMVAIPTTAVLKIIFLDLKTYYQNLDFYKN